MNSAFEKRYRRIGVIMDIVEKINEQFQPGKTKLQKLVYLSQVLYDIPLEYRFEPYNYGPYSDELTTDISNLEFRGLLSVTFDNEGYHIEANEEPIPEKAMVAKTEYSEKISNLIKNWGSLQVKELELYTTFIYVDRLFIRNKEEISKEKMIEIVNEIKPQFADRSDEAFDFLNERDIFINKLS